MNPTLLVPDIDDDATRRRYLTLLATAGLLTACTSPGADPAAMSPAQTRTVDHTAGSTEVPMHPLRVAVLDNTIAAGLVALGLIPTTAGGASTCS